MDEKRIAELRALKDVGMVSAVGEYTPDELWEALDCIERLRAERDQARAQVERSVQLLVGIHELLYPAPITTPDGRTLVFRPQDEDPHAILQELSDRIRALPNEVESARRAIYSAEQAQIEAPLRAEIARLRALLADAPKFIAGADAFPRRVD